MVISRLMPRGVTARSAAAAAGIVLLAGACGGGSSGAEQAAELSAVAADTSSDADNRSDTAGSDVPEPTANAAEAPASDDSGSDTADAAEAASPFPDSGDAAAETESGADPSVNELADVEVIDVATGDPVNLKSFAPADKPIVLWFWAPH